jgi:hypothetical protein
MRQTEPAATARRRLRAFQGEEFEAGLAGLANAPALGGLGEVDTPERSHAAQPSLLAAPPKAMNLQHHN